MVYKIIYLILSLVLVLNVSGVRDSLVHEKGRCLTYGISYDNTHYSVHNGPPKPLTDKTAINILTEHCSLYRNQDVCCDPAQLVRLNYNLNMASGLLGRCDSCWNNFRTILCQQMCSPDQSTFMEVLEQIPVPGQELFAARSFLTSLTEEYAVKLFDSCSEVQAYGMQAIDLICSDANCTYARLLKELGDNSSRAPFYTDYYVGNAQDKAIQPLEANVLSHCWEAPEGGEACTCEDCSEICRQEMVTASYDRRPCNRNSAEALQEAWDEVENSKKVTFSATKKEVTDGSIATMICNNGYDVSGTGMLTCRHRDWGLLPSCYPILCSKSSAKNLKTAWKAIENSNNVLFSVNKNDITDGSMAWLICESGYCITGDDVLTCHENSWGELPTCDECEEEGNDENDNEEELEDNEDQEAEEEVDKEEDSCSGGGLEAVLDEEEGGDDLIYEHLVEAATNYPDFAAQQP